MQWHKHTHTHIRIAWRNNRLRNSIRNIYCREIVFIESILFGIIYEQKRGKWDKTKSWQMFYIMKKKELIKSVEQPTHGGQIDRKNVYKKRVWI